MMTPTLTIRCRENGPLVVEGPVRVVDHQGNELAPPQGKEKIALCRCGASSNKPYCDGEHKRIAFDGGVGKGKEVDSQP